MTEKFYVENKAVCRSGKSVQEMQSKEYAKKLAKHLNEIHNK